MLVNFVWFDAQHHVASVGDYMIDHMKKALKIKTHRKKSRPSPKFVSTPNLSNHMESR